MVYFWLNEDVKIYLKNKSLLDMKSFDMIGTYEKEYKHV